MSAHESRDVRLQQQQVAAPVMAQTERDMFVIIQHAAKQLSEEHYPVLLGLVPVSQMLKDFELRQLLNCTCRQALLLCFCIVHGWLR